MKLSKFELKNIVKECLVEILSEGIGSPNSPQGNQVVHSAKSTTSNQPQRKITPYLSNAIKKESGGNKIMEMILADTAASTLPKMLEGDTRGKFTSQAGGGLVEQALASAEPNEIFGEEVTSKWAELAFMGSSLKK